MSPRQMRVMKGGQYHSVSMETFIERVRKARALGCNLSYLGIDSQILKRPTTNRISTFIEK